MRTGHNSFEAFEVLEGRRLFSFPVGIGSTETDRVVDVSADDTGDVVAVGTFEGTVDFDPGSGVAELSGGGGFVAKYTPDGALVWARGFAGATPAKVDTDREGNVYFAGAFTGTVDFDPRHGSHEVASLGGTDGFVCKLSSKGNLVVVKDLGGAGEEAVTGLAVSRDGVMYVGGSFNGIVNFADPSQLRESQFTMSSDVSAADGFLASFDQEGEFRWSGSFSGSGAKELTDVALDGAGGVLATGRYVGTVDFNPRKATLNAVAGTQQAFALKWDAATGRLDWMAGLGGTGTALGRAITADRAGNVYTLGGFSGTADFDPGAGTVDLTAPAGGRVFVSKLDSAGRFFGVLPFGGSTSVEAGPGDVAVDKFQDVYVTGRFSGTQNFNPVGGTTNLTSAGADDVFVVRTNNAGTPVFARGMGGTGADAGFGLALDRNGNVIVGGTFTGTANFGTTGSPRDLTSAGEEDGFVTRLTGEGGEGEQG